MNNMELHFSHQIKQFLNENIEKLSPSVEDRLASARKLALSRKKKSSSLRFYVTQNAFGGQVGGLFNSSVPFWGRLGVALPLFAGALIFMSLYEFEKEQRVYELAELDLAVLSDDLPVSAYADQGFKAFLTVRDE